MAVITSFQKDVRPPSRNPTDVVCHWSMASFSGGGPILQLTTHGSKTRKQPGKPSQVLQLTKESAAMLYAILKREFEFT